MYLSLIKDSYYKKNTGYDLSSSLNTEETLRVLKMDISNRTYLESALIYHSDRGVQYYSDIYQRVLTNNNIETSMTEPYESYANAIAEMINWILKQEFILEQYNFPLEIMKTLIKDVVSIYNSQRPIIPADI